MKNDKRLATGLTILGMIAAAPLAFAQSTTAETPPTEAAAPPATGAAEQQPSQSAASGQSLSWAELDVDGNGSLSQQEAKRHDGLSQVFAQADADANGELTADEYRSFFQKQQGGATQP